MRRFTTISLLALLLAYFGTTLAGAQDTDPGSASSVQSTTSPTMPSSSSSGLKLFAGVSHQEMLPQAHLALQPHLDRQTKYPVATQVVQQAPPAIPQKPPVVQQKPLVFLQKPNLAAETAAKQAYEPAFGVARMTVQRNPDPPRPVQHYTIDWFMLPAGMAGVWVKNGDMTTSVTDLRSGMNSAQKEWTENKLEAVWGHQQDAQGNYWHVNLLPSERDGSSSGKRVRFVTVSQQCVNSSPQYLLTRSHYIVSESNPWNNQSIDTFQQESLNNYALAGQNQLVNTSSNRVFSYEGVPIREGSLVSQFAKIGQFAPLASLNGVDLRASLNDYLQSHSLGHLKK